MKDPHRLEQVTNGISLVIANNENVHRLTLVMDLNQNIWYNLQVYTNVMFMALF